MFSRANDALGMRRSDGRSAKQPIQDDGQIEAPVEPILDLSEITMTVLHKVERVVGTAKGNGTYLRP